MKSTNRILAIIFYVIATVLSRRRKKMRRIPRYQEMPPDPPQGPNPYDHDETAHYNNPDINAYDHDAEAHLPQYTPYNHDIQDHDQYTEYPWNHNAIDHPKPVDPYDHTVDDHYANPNKEFDHNADAHPYYPTPETPTPEQECEWCHNECINSNSCSINNYNDNCYKTCFEGECKNKCEGYHEYFCPMGGNSLSRTNKSTAEEKAQDCTTCRTECEAENGKKPTPGGSHLSCRMVCTGSSAPSGVADASVCKEKCTQLPPTRPPHSRKDCPSFCNPGSTCGVTCRTCQIKGGKYTCNN